MSFSPTYAMMYVGEVANKLWSDVTIIDDYLKENEDIPEEHKEIIGSWKRRIDPGNVFDGAASEKGNDLHLCGK